MATLMTTRQTHSGYSDDQKRHGGDVVPVPTASTSRDGPPEELPARSSGEPASAREGISSPGMDKSEKGIGKTTNTRPGYWTPKRLPRYSDLGSVTRREYYDKAWSVEERMEELEIEDVLNRDAYDELLKKNRMLERELGRIVGVDVDEEKKMEMEKGIEMAKEREACVYELQDKLREARAAIAAREEKEGYRRSVRIQTNLAADTVSAHAQTDPPAEECATVGVQTEPMVGERVPEPCSEASPEIGFMGRLAKVEREVARMVEVVALLVQTVSLQGDRLTGEGLSLAPGGGAGAWQAAASSGEGEREEMGSPRTSLPSVVCGAPKGGRPTGGGGGAASKKRRRGVGEKTGVSPPTQQRKVGNDLDSDAAGGRGLVAEMYSPVGRFRAAVHPPGEGQPLAVPPSRGHPAAIGPVPRPPRGGKEE